MKSILLASLLLLPCMGNARVLELDPSSSVIEPDGYIDFFSDTTGEMSINEVRMVEFTGSDQIPGFGYSSKFHWYRITVHNSINEPVEWLIRSGSRFMRPIEIFLDDSGTTTRILYNDETQPFKEREFATRYLTVPITLRPHQNLTIYIRFRAGGAAVFPFIFAQPEEIFRQNAKSMAMTSALVAILLTLIVINFFHFLASRQSAYLLYCLQEVSIAAYLIHIDGYGFQYLWPDFPGFNAIASPLLGSVSIALSILFSINFLAMDRYTPRLRKVLHFLAFAALTISISSLFIDIRLTNQMSLLVGIAAILLLVPISAYITYKGYQSGIYYLAAWLVRLVGSLQFAWFAGGMSDAPTINTLDNLKISVALQAIVFSLGLAAHYRRLVAEHQRTQQNLVTSLNQRLEAARELAAVERDKELALKQVYEKSKILATTSHDMVQPIRSLRLALNENQGVIKDLQLSNSFVKTLDSMEDILGHALNDASNALRQVTEELDTNIEKLLTDLSLRFQNEASEKSLFIRVHAINVNLHLSYIALQRCIGNLISNAIHFTETGGILLAARRRGSRILIQVWDTGIGMSADSIKEFTPILGKSPESAGHGLGFAIVNEICASRRWELRIDSVPGRGTCISLLVPENETTADNR